MAKPKDPDHCPVCGLEVTLTPAKQLIPKHTIGGYEHTATCEGSGQAPGIPVLD